MVTTHADSVLLKLGVSLKIPDLHFDERNVCALSIDNYRVSMLATSRQSILVYGVIGRLPKQEGSQIDRQEIELALMRELLTINLTLAQSEGPRLALDPSAAIVLLTTSVRLRKRSDDHEVLEAKIEVLVRYMEALLQVFRNRVGLERLE